MKHLLILFLAGLISTSCQKKDENSTSPETKAFTSEKNAFFSYLKNPTETSSTLSRIPGGFDSTLMNDPTHFIHYTGNTVRAAANLGIYLSDLNYCILFEKSTITKEYFLASQELSKAIGIEKRILEFLMKRYTESLDKNDSVRAVVNQLFEKSTRDLQGTDREKLAGIAMAAYQIENLYLALAVLKSSSAHPDADPQTSALLSNYIVEQQTNLEIIYNFIRTFSDPLDPDKNPNYPFYDNALRDLIGVYQKIRNQAPPENGKGTNEINEVLLIELHDKVNALRSKIVDIG